MPCLLGYFFRFGLFVAAKVPFGFCHKIHLICVCLCTPVSSANYRHTRVYKLYHVYPVYFLHHLSALAEVCILLVLPSIVAIDS